MRFQNVNRFRNVSSIPIGQNLAKSRNLYGTSFHEILLITFLVLGQSYRKVHLAKQLNAQSVAALGRMDFLVDTNSNNKVV